MDACRAIIWVLVVLAHRVQQGSEQRAAVLDQYCISWTLRTSLDGPIRLLTLSYLATVTPADLGPTLVADCFDILLGCVKNIEGEVVIIQGMEQLVTVSALCCLHTYSNLVIVDPKSTVLFNAFRRFVGIFPLDIKYNTLLLPLALRLTHAMVVYHTCIVFSIRCWVGLQEVEWEDCNLSNDDHAIIARALTVLARFYHQVDEKVSRWVLRFVLHSLSRSPPPSTSVVTSCLSIIAVDLGCDSPNVAVLDERCVHI